MVHVAYGYLQLCSYCYCNFFRRAHTQLSTVDNFGDILEKDIHAQQILLSCYMECTSTKRESLVIMRCWLEHIILNLAIINL